jgi:hypothetical protein
MPDRPMNASFDIFICAPTEQGVFDKLGRLFKSSKPPVASSEQKVRIADGTRHTCSDHVDAATRTRLYLYLGITCRRYRLNRYGHSLACRRS